MAYKLRRPLLLGFDNNIYSKFYSEQPTMQMDCGLSAFSSSSTTATASAAPKANAGSSAMMDGQQSERSPAKTHKDGLHVNFETEKVEVQERKKKFLTAKYGTHQMNLIKKRLGVEMWVYDQLQYLYSSKDDAEVELDLDELLDVDDDIDRRNWLLGKLVNAKQSQEEVRKFIEELLKRAKTL